MFIDSHCHIDLEAFASDRSEVIESAYEKGVQKLLIPGLYVQQFEQLLDLKATYNCDIAFGLHPYYLSTKLPAPISDKINVLACMVEKHHREIVAIGEIGLDKHIEYPLEKQIEILKRQMEVAMNYAKPIILHHRGTHNEIILCLKHTKFQQGGIIHAFSGSYELAKTYVEKGFLLGIGGTITYDRANKTKDAIKRIGVEHLVLETDAPDMPIAGYQGQRNTPERIPIIAKTLADILNESVEKVAQICSRNYSSLFSSPST